MLDTTELFCLIPVSFSRDLVFHSWSQGYKSIRIFALILLQRLNKTLVFILLESFEWICQESVCRVFELSWLGEVHDHHYHLLA